MAVIGLCGNLILQMANAQPADNSATLLEKINIVDFSKPAGTWSGAIVGQSLAVHDRLRTGEESRAAAKLGDASVLRLDELTTIEILPPKEASEKATLDINQGSTYFFSREKAREITIQTPAANGAIRGTEFLLSVSAKKRTVVTMLGGEFALSNEFGLVVVQKGEQAQAEPGQKPTKRAINKSSDGVPVSLLIESKLPPGKTIMTANQSELILAVRASAKQWPVVASQIVKLAVQSRQ